QIGPQGARPFAVDDIGPPGDRDQLAHAHAALDGDVLAELQAERLRRRERGALGAGARLALLAARDALLHALALAAHGVALLRVRRRRAGLGLDRHACRRQARRRRLAGVV